MESGIYYGYYSGGEGSYYGSYNGSGIVSDGTSYYAYQDPYQQFTREWDELTTKEKAVILTVMSYLDLRALKTNRGLAVFECARRFNSRDALMTLKDGRGDAFRHAFFNALNARDLGEWKTKLMSDAHEDFPSNPPIQRQMDLFNNARGIQLGLANPDASVYELAEIIYQDLLDGNLREIRAGVVIATGPGPGEITPIRRSIALGRLK